MGLRWVIWLLLEFRCGQSMAYRGLLERGVGVLPDFGKADVQFKFTSGGYRPNYDIVMYSAANRKAPSFVLDGILQ
jgi:hypothetical protein